ncbi:hypothetical protein C8Q74DRAFT_278403 [Fomes fomentarius]|nr:hypothetical protein C8Q74DRAFT_278403 [Fomes fomentarius]
MNGGRCSFLHYASSVVSICGNLHGTTHIGGVFGLYSHWQLQGFISIVCASSTSLLESRGYLGLHSCTPRHHTSRHYGEPLGTSVSDKMLACVPVSSRSTMEVSSSGTRKVHIHQKTTSRPCIYCRLQWHMRGFSRRESTTTVKFPAYSFFLSNCSHVEGRGTYRCEQSSHYPHTRIRPLAPNDMNGPTPCGHNLIRWAAKMSGEGRAAPHSPFPSLPF